ncbi:MAG: type II toxin-antitoxin system Phd/YefM family antitoxin [Halieaceae bacterium]
MESKKVKVTQVNMHEAKTRLSQLAEMVWRGEEVVIAKAGKPYLDLKPHVSSGTARQPGRYKDAIELAADFEDTPTSILDDFEGST